MCVCVYTCYVPVQKNAEKAHFEASGKVDRLSLSRGLKEGRKWGRKGEGELRGRKKGITGKNKRVVQQEGTTGRNKREGKREGTT